MSEIVKFEKTRRMTLIEEMLFLAERHLVGPIVSDELQRECEELARREGLLKCKVGEKWTKFINSKPKEGFPCVEFHYELFCEKE